MRVLCWNTNESVREHWRKVCSDESDLVISQSLENTVNLLERESFDYCFIYLDKTEFSEKVEQVVMLCTRFTAIDFVAFPYMRSQTAAIRMLSAGVKGQCSPFIAKEQLGLVLSVINSGEIWGGKEFIEQLIKQSDATAELSGDLTSFEGGELLSERELSVALRVAEGLSNKDIALSLNVTERTIKAHLTSIYKKLHIKDRLSLALLVKKGRQPQDDYIASNN